jgi:tRNA threonylcarbamoyladenosine biosynthesis protein TsaB
MIILTLRSDSPQAEIGLFDDDKQLGYETWQAHRMLAETVHQKMKALLAAHDKDFQDIEGLVAYKGPGSFTGLRISLSVVNALAAGYNVPAVGATGDDWIKEGISRLLKGDAPIAAVLPEYGSPAHITQPRK